ncbi:16S rRNA (cytosine(1402)-N(4))-methyltransferase RsmH [Selenomonas sp.]|uniref:16S rRNA (cytosine(1402)-N(4))-methyltransferase RsmH n=1 Tax=Selenomonas sp. TaxID=2053611 RepID=UPI002A765323|nr:16S rRNA (cytosine(1402)-N(4))-methyltransferase RsmH [Selenomonas sp.]MDY3296856.1 16S rRNA (cytosine(1402)-N(4))-methyltransferase RsmH [Selenomonas sp.]
MTDFHHISVMPEEVLSGLAVKPDGTYVDCTLGGAGHSARIAALLSERGHLIGIDQDGEAIAAAQERLADARCRVDIVHDNFRNLAQILTELDVPAVDGVLFDLGVSSHQLDTAERGFSYMQDAPLDMRMDESAAFSAYDVVNTYSEDDLDRIFHDYGEERWARRIARFIVDARAAKPVETTGELVDIVCKAIPKAVRRAENGHPAKRIFQAIRIEVNDELGILEQAFHAASDALKPGGRLVIITFHSLEDRIAKNALRDMARGCICPPELPVCVCHHHPELKLLVKGTKATKDELAANTRAKSAKLRVAEKLPPFVEEGGAA